MHRDTGIMSAWALVRYATEPDRYFNSNSQFFRQLFLWNKIKYSVMPYSHSNSTNTGFPVLLLLFGALWFILRGDLLYVLPCVILFVCFSILLALRLPCLGKRQIILVLFVCLIDLCLFVFVGSLFLLVSGKGRGLWLSHSLDFSLTFFFHDCSYLM